MRGLRRQIREPAVAPLWALMTFRTLRKNVLILFVAGFIRNFPWVFRILCPRKSHPFSIFEVGVFLGGRANPPPFKKPSTTGFSSLSSSSLGGRVMRKSSARRIRLTLGHTCFCPFQILLGNAARRQASKPSSAIFRMTGEQIPPWGVPASVG